MRGVLLLALVAGCGPTFVKLEPAKVQRIDVALVGGGNTVCPTAGTPQLRALVTYLDHKRLQTRSRVDPQGTLRPADLRWTSDVGAINANAELELPPLQAWHDRPLSITVNVPGVWMIVSPKASSRPRYVSASATDSAAKRRERLRPKSVSGIMSRRDAVSAAVSPGAKLGAVSARSVASSGSTRRNTIRSHTTRMIAPSIAAAMTTRTPNCLRRDSILIHD
jgi:hypothetical protein